VPVCGYDVRILDPDGRERPAGEDGAIAIRRPLPPGCLLTLWDNPERFRQAYMTTYPGYYFSDDGGYRDADGYVYITGRLDDIIKVAGHRLSTAEIEEAVASHPDVAECAVVGVADELKGEIPLGLVVLKSNADIDAKTLEADIRARVREYVGPIASFKRVIIVPQLPKTRSGKILRGIIRCIVAGEDVALPSTIEDPAALKTLVATFQKQ
jgi:propionyl-CoA synthetase